MMLGVVVIIVVVIVIAKVQELPYRHRYHLSVLWVMFSAFPQRPPLSGMVVVLRDRHLHRSQISEQHGGRHRKTG